MTLTEHINQKYGGNKAAFGRANNMRPQEVQKLFTAKNPFHVIDGKLFQLKKEIN